MAQRSQPRRGGSEPDAASEDGFVSAELQQQFLDLGRSAGLDAIGVADAGPLEPARSVLQPRKESGLAGTMQFTYRNPDRSTDPSRVLPGARAIVAGARGYRRRVPTAPRQPAGRVARYAWRDHYADLKLSLETVAEALRDEGWAARVHADDNNLVDRNVAFRAGLGWYGKNANLLIPDAGSWFVLGSIVTDAPLRPTAHTTADGCGPCRRCLDGCPTGAIVGPGIIDARRCLAWLVQGPGPIPVEFREAVGDRLYGCDDCQDVCPPNRALESQAPTGDETTRDDAPPAEADSDAWVELEFVLTAGDDELMARVGRWYIAERDPDVVRRTALVVLGNTADPADPRVRQLLDRHLDGPSDLLREHAQWAERQLGLAD